MTFRFPKLPWKRVSTVAGILLVLGLGAMSPRWWPRFSKWVDATLAGYDSASPGEEGHAEHADHEGHADHAAVEFLELSPSAQANLGLLGVNLKPNGSVAPIELMPYSPTLTVPAVVMARPGRTQLHVSTPMTGIITHVHAVTGETVYPGDLLFEIRLTHEDLVVNQTQFLETLEELDVEKAEIEWLEGALTAEGRLLRDRIYARDQLEARQLALREALKLHGLSERQVDWISENRRLLDTLQVIAPSIDTHADDEELRLSGLDLVPVSYDDAAGETDDESAADSQPQPEEKPMLLIESLDVHKGESVDAGEELCVLADYRELFIEGQAFESDAAVVLRAAEEGWNFTAVTDGPEHTPSQDREPPDSESSAPTEGEAGPEDVEGLLDLELAYVSNLIDPVTRVLPFYLHLQNEPIVDTTNDENQRFVTWRYRPGQRMSIRVPLDNFEDQIVLPVEAVARDGAESYVFRQNGPNRFDRVSVTVLYRDTEYVVIARNGAITPGDYIARRSAHEIQMAIKNKSGGAIDPHAGHSHG